MFEEVANKFMIKEEIEKRISLKTFRVYFYKTNLTLNEWKDLESNLTLTFKANWSENTYAQTQHTPTLTHKKLSLTHTQFEKQ